MWCGCMMYSCLYVCMLYDFGIGECLYTLLCKARERTLLIMCWINVFLLSGEISSHLQKCSSCSLVVAPQYCSMLQTEGGTDLLRVLSTHPDTHSDVKCLVENILKILERNLHPASPGSKRANISVQWTCSVNVVVTCDLIILGIQMIQMRFNRRAQALIWWLKIKKNIYFFFCLN